MLLYKKLLLMTFGTALVRKVNLVTDRSQFLQYSLLTHRSVCGTLGYQVPRLRFRQPDFSPIVAKSLTFQD